MKTETYTLGEESRVHLLPCSIAYDGNAPVNDFFKVKKGDGAKTADRAAFRGRALQGREVVLPPQVQGIVLGKMEGGGGCVSVDGAFSKLTMWEHDVQPDTGVMQDCLHWFEVADAVHAMAPPPSETE